MYVKGRQGEEGRGKDKEIGGQDRGELVFKLKILYVL
jgi:hypothetical protein